MARKKTRRTTKSKTNVAASTTSGARPKAKAAAKKKAPARKAAAAAAKKTGAPKRTAPKKTPAAKKTAPKKTPAAKKTPKKTAPKKTAPKKAGAPKRTAPKKTPAAKKTAPKKTAPKKTAPKKAGAPKRTAPKKTAPKKTAPKKTAPEKAGAPKRTAPKKTPAAKKTAARKKTRAPASKPASAPVIVSHAHLARLPRPPMLESLGLETAADPLARLHAEVMPKLRDAQTRADVLGAPNDPLAALFQSWVADEQVKPASKPAQAGGLEAVLDERDWAGWAKSFFTWAGRIVKHDFLPPAEDPIPIPNDCRVAILGDWGSGLYGAPVCAASIQTASPRFDVLLHLGDVYYSGTQKEVRLRFLDLWPSVSGAKSIALNSNHEMYSGGHGYFGLTLPAFGQGSSAVALQNDDWLLIGLDTGYAEHQLAGDQAAWVGRLIQRAGTRRVVLFSHHQPFSLFETQGELLVSQLGSLLDRVFAWYWGHEHRCVIYDRSPDGLWGRCIGHSGFPYFRDRLDANKVARSMGEDRWVEVVRHGTPRGLVLDGPNAYVPGYEDQYGPNGWASLELRGRGLRERVHRPDGSVIHEQVLAD